MQRTDSFVKGILDDVAEPSSSDFVTAAPLGHKQHRASARDETAPTQAHHRYSQHYQYDASGAASGRYDIVAAEPHDDDGAGADGPLLRPQRRHAMQRAQPMFRYALVFINFSFIVASMLLIMAGVVARENSALKLCRHCGDLTLVTIIFGVLLWLFALFGFNWIRQRNILFLLIYVAFLVLLSAALLAILISAGVFDASVKRASESNSDFLDQWIVSVNETSPTGYSAICDLQQQYNCSGFWYGCCDPGTCFVNHTAPSWAGEVCPHCPIPPAPRTCTGIVFSTVRKNLGGFLVISSFSTLLVMSGILLATLSRRVNVLLEDG